MPKLPHSSQEKGEFIKEQWLRGAKFLPDTLLKERPTWADQSANIAGLPGWTDEQAVRFLMTALAYNGLPARPPMPPYRFNHEDAEAILAYLWSLATLSRKGQMQLIKKTLMLRAA